MENNRKYAPNLFQYSTGIRLFAILGTGNTARNETILPGDTFPPGVRGREDLAGPSKWPSKWLYYMES